MNTSQNKYYTKLCEKRQMHIYSTMLWLHSGMEGEDWHQQQLKCHCRVCGNRLRQNLEIPVESTAAPL